MAETELVDDSPPPAESVPEDAEIDLDASAPQGIPCPACGCPVERHDKFCPACGTPHEVPAAAAPPAAPQKHFRCDNCGSEVATDPDTRSYVCPFCDSTYVVEFSPEVTDRQAPEFVIGFGIPPEEAMEKFRAWIATNGWFQPGDLTSTAVADKMKGVYLPFWSFSMLAESHWDASIGEHWYRTETYTTTDSKGRTVTRTRRVQETEWWPLRGRHHRFYSGFLVSGSRGLPQADAERIKPFNLPALKRYEPYFLAGWLSEEYSVERESALEICQTEFHRREERNIAAFLPGDRHRSLEVATTFSRVRSDLCLLPVYLLSYQYRDHVYRFLVNGQTGRTHGTKPTSGKRIAAVVLGVLALIALIILIIALANR